MNKFLRLTLISLSSIALVGCGGTTSGNTSAEGASTQTSAEVVDTPTLTGSYLSPAQLGYSNMRPTYNYYLTTFAFQNLETYSDNTYCLTLSSSTFSAVILPEEGNDATGNERNNSLVKYYGAFTSTVDDLDDDTVYYHLSEPSRIVGSDDTLFFYDTANWTDDMKEKTADVTYKYDAETGSQKATGKKEYATGAEYLLPRSSLLLNSPLPRRLLP
jgi:ABC-type Fe3+-hydroxamate transport system substrate-binding protein